VYVHSKAASGPAPDDPFVAAARARVVGPVAPAPTPSVPAKAAADDGF
jgi:hypothetical protein